MNKDIYTEVQQILDSEQFIFMFAKYCPESQDRKKKLCKDYKDINVDKLIAVTYDLNLEIPSRAEKFIDQNVQFLINYQNDQQLLVLLVALFEGQDLDKLYMVGCLYFYIQLLKLQNKRIQVKEFLLKSVETPKGKIAMFKIMLNVQRRITSTTFKRYIFLNLCQITYLYIPYFDVDEQNYSKSKLVTPILDDIATIMIQNYKQIEFIQLAFETLIVMLSNWQDVEDVKLAYKYLSIQLKTLSKKQFNAEVNNVFEYFEYLERNKLSIPVEKTEDNHQEKPKYHKTSDFLKEAIVYLQFIVRDRGLDESYKLKVSEYIHAEIDQTFVVKFYWGQMLIPHTLNNHYSFKTYLWAQIIHLASDLMTDIVQDILSLKSDTDLNLLDKNHIEVTQQCEEEFYTAIYQMDKTRTMIKSFHIRQVMSFDVKKLDEKTVYRGYLDKPLDTNQKYFYMILHGSMFIHFQTLSTLKKLFQREVTDQILQKAVAMSSHRPVLQLLNIGKGSVCPSDSPFRSSIFSFCLDSDQGIQTLINILQRSTRLDFQLVKERQGDLHINVIQAQRFKFFFDSKLASKCLPLRPAQGACLIHSQVKDILCIVGAPGTGKTFTTVSIAMCFLTAQRSTFFTGNEKLMNLFPQVCVLKDKNILQLLTAQPIPHQIILTAHSNNAVDQMASALTKLDYGVSQPFMFRLGGQSTLADLQDYTMEGYLEKVYKYLRAANLVPPAMTERFDKLLKQGKITVDSIRYIMTPSKTYFRLVYDCFSCKSALQKALLKAANVVCGTINGFQNVINDISPNGFLIVEEAARIAEYNIASLVSLIPSKIVLIGDILQLPPLVREERLETEAGLTKSLFHKLIHSSNNVIVLDEQMRVHSSICNLYRTIYRKYLPKQISLPRGLRDGRKFDERNGVFAHIVEKSGRDEVSWPEISAIEQLHDDLMKEYKNEQISVLSYYKRQANELSKVLGKRCYTVDEYQGLENDVVIVSLVLQNPSRFGNDLNRALVAFSRARLELHVVGNIFNYDNDIFKVLQKFIKQNYSQMNQSISSSVTYLSDID